MGSFLTRGNFLSLDASDANIGIIAGVSEVPAVPKNDKMEVNF